MKNNVLITDETGFIGKYLTPLLIQNGFSASMVIRS